ncbi:MAG TPA: HAD-IB family hydrolase [Myxococcales bacterium]|jgi:HAD superfamily hydrolase (TIGR01490 family)|nr:HAD-IB family hydrolase [Myxococcales bacterium]
MQPFQRTAAIFDIDDSLLDGNAGTIFTSYLYTNREMIPAVRSQVPRALYEYARKRSSEADMVAFGSKCQQGIRVDRLRDLAQRCFERNIKKRVTQAGLRTVRKHLLQGHLVIVASGSPQFIIDELGRFLHAHEAVGTRALIKQGISTDELVSPIVFREGKRERVKQVLARHAIDVERCYLYSDSVADTPLFEEVGYPVVVNPKPAFRGEALRRGWEVVEWKGRWKNEPETDQLGEEWLSWEG